MDALGKSQTCDKSASQGRDYYALENRQIFENPQHIASKSPYKRSNPNSPSSNQAIFYAMEINMKEKVEQFKTKENHAESVLSKSSYLIQ